MNQEMEKVDVSFLSIVKFFIVFILFYMLFLVKGIIVWIVLSLILSILLNPLIDNLEKKKISRTFSAIIVYFLLIAILAGFLFLAVPPIIKEAQSFSQNISIYFTQISTYLAKLGLGSNVFYSLLDSLKVKVFQASSDVLTLVSALFSSVFAIVTIFALAFFFSVEKSEIAKVLDVISPSRWKENILKMWERTQEKVSNWFIGRVLSSIGVGVMTFILCVFLKVKLAVFLSFLAGALNLIPFIGPLVAGAVLFFVAAVDSGSKALIALLFTIVIQQIENNVLTPFFTKKMLGIPVFLVLISVLIGGELLGAVGAFLAIPVAAIIYESLKDYSN